MFGNRQTQVAPLAEQQDPSGLNPTQHSERKRHEVVGNRVSGNPAPSRSSISDCCRSDSSASAGAPGPEIPTELKQTSQENSSASSKPLSRRSLPRAPAAGDPPRRDPPLERPGSSRKGPGLKFKIHFQPKPDSRLRQGLWGNSHFSRTSPPPAPSNVLLGWLLVDLAGDPRALGESRQPQPARAHTRMHTQTHSRECVFTYRTWGGKTMANRWD